MREDNKAQEANFSDISDSEIVQDPMEGWSLIYLTATIGIENKQVLLPHTADAQILGEKGIIIDKYFTHHRLNGDLNRRRTSQS